MVFNLDGSGHFLHNKDGVNQGDPLAMITYGIGVITLIRELEDAHPRVTQPWHADDAGAGGNFDQILAHFWDLQAGGAPWGYFPEPTNSILVVAPRNVARAEEFFRGMFMMVVTRSRYLGGFISNREAEDIWITEGACGQPPTVSSPTTPTPAPSQVAIYPRPPCC